MEFLLYLVTSGTYLEDTSSKRLNLQKRRVEMVGFHSTLILKPSTQEICTQESVIVGIAQYAVWQDQKSTSWNVQVQITIGISSTLGNHCMQSTWVRTITLVL